VVAQQANLAAPVNADAARRKVLTLVAMTLGFVVVQLDVTVVNVALRAVGSSLQSGVAGLQWMVNAYTIAFASLMLTAGSVGDRYGAKRIFIAGFAVFVVASLGCGLAPNIGLLIFFRAVQGLGAAMLVPCSLSLLNHAYISDQERTKALGVWAAGASAALAAGPVLGGALIAAIGWRSIFFINLPLGLVGILLTWRYSEETTQTENHEIDYWGQFLGIVSLAAVAASTIEGGSLGWSNRWVLVGFALGLVAIIAFLWVEARSKAPMLPLTLFNERVFTSATLVGFLTNIAFYGLIFVLSLFFQELRSYSALKTGIAFVPMMAIILAANLAAGPLSSRIGPPALMVAGQALFAIGCFMLLRAAPETSFMAMLLQLLAIGAGIGLTVPPMTSVLLGSVEKRMSGIASGVLNSSRQVGSVFGVALFGSLIAHKAQFVRGLHTSLLISAIAASCGCAIALLVKPMKSTDVKSKPKLSLAA
jgi:DHA2 family methylenomycin A resistance protein-like MFS transporter